MGVSDEAKNVIPLKFLRKIKNKKCFPLVNSIRGHTVYSYGHGISSVILVSIRKKLCSLSFIVSTNIQHFCDRGSVTHNKNQNAT
jgi:hypothetical protein